MSPLLFVLSVTDVKINIVNTLLIPLFFVYTVAHRWDLPGNYPVFTTLMVIYYYIEIIWRILVTPVFLYNLDDH